MDEYRAVFDAEVTFANGGGLQVQDFRLDIADNEINNDDLAVLFVRRLGLLMVKSVTIGRKSVIVEQHKHSRGAPKAIRASGGGLVELSHAIHHGMVTYPGLPGPEITDHLSRQESRKRYSPGTEFHIGRISMVANTGTYLDTPSHRYEDGADLSAMPLSTLVDIPGVVVRVPLGVKAIDKKLLAPYRVEGAAVLVHTGWDRYWGTEAYGAGGHPYITLDGATHLVQAGARLVGIDSVNIDDTTDGTRPAHTTLLRHGLPIVEHLRGLGELPPDGFRFHAAPPLIAGMGTFPVRAYAILSAP
jgi:kynurenine formamidase